MWGSSGGLLWFICKWVSSKGVKPLVWSNQLEEDGVSGYTVHFASVKASGVPSGL